MDGGSGVAGISRPATRDPRRSRWILLAASLAIGWGVFSIAFAAATWSVEAFVAPTSWLVLGWPLAAIVSGAGVLRLRPWARVLAGVLAALTLASDASGLLLDPTSTARSPLGAIEIVGSVLMLYVLLWQWPVAGRDR